MPVKTVTYTKALGMYVLGFKTMDTHMEEMIRDGWRVQAQIPDTPKSFFPGVKIPPTMIVTYVKDYF